jgi:hypothetical protein
MSLTKTLKIHFLLLYLNIEVLNQYILTGMSVAYAAPRRHPMICVVENNFCASRRGEFSYTSFSKIFMMCLGFF